MPIDQSEFLENDGVRLAYRASRGSAGRAGIVWLGGFHSDMLGEKASTLHVAAVEAERSFVRFDYLGHGESGGRFEEGTIGRWRSDALAVIDKLTEGPLVLVGSSMGGWMALLCALVRERVRGMTLLAPAPDFTEKLMWAGLGEAERREIVEKGFWTRPSAYDPAGYPIRRELIEEGKRWNVLDAEIPLHLPVRIVHGGRDEDVPWTHSRRLVEKLHSDDVTWTLVKDGDHRLSRPGDIALMVRTVLALADQVDASA